MTQQEEFAHLMKIMDVALTFIPDEFAIGDKDDVWDVFDASGLETALGHLYTILDLRGVNIEEFEAALIKAGLYESVDP